MQNVFYCYKKLILNELKFILVVLNLNTVIEMLKISPVYCSNFSFTFAYPIVNFFSYF